MSTRIKSDGGSIEWLPLDSLVVPEILQRKFIQAHANTIAENFDPDKFGVPTVVVMKLPGHHTDSFVLVDGQHRCWAARQALGPGQSIQCKVIRGNMTLERAAKIALGLSQFKLQRPIDKFKRSVVANDPDALHITEIAKKFGLVIADGGAPSNLSCVTVVQRIHRAPGGPERLPLVLEILLGAWAGTSGAVAGDVVGGMALFMIRYAGLVDTKVLQTRLAALAGGPSGLLGKARSIRAGFGGTIDQAVARAILAIYNSGRRTHALPEWHETKKGKD